VWQLILSFAVARLRGFVFEKCGEEKRGGGPRKEEGGRETSFFGEREGVHGDKCSDNDCD